MKKFISGLLLFSLLMIDVPVKFTQTANAATMANVVINEIAWMGSADSANDEWIELYNTTTSDIDLTNWTIDDDDGIEIYTITSGVIPAGGYFLIEDAEEATSVAAGAVIPVSLSNTGDSLLLKDETGNPIDSVNFLGGMWAAGDNTNKLTMERKTPLQSGDFNSNWANNTAPSGATGRSGSIIKGTPKAQNSVYSGPVQPSNPEVTFQDLSVNPIEGSNFDITVSVSNVTDLYSYGFDIFYDPAVINFTGASNGSFLTDSNFFDGLENDTEGKIVVGASRLTAPPSGISGSGDLFTLSFSAVSTGTTTLTFGPDSFLSDTSSQITVTFDDDSVTVDPQTVDPVQNLNITEGANRYELSLTWDAPSSGANSYKIYRKDASGAFIQIAETASASYTDANALIPNHTYEYRVTAVKGSLESSAVNGQKADTRGLKGDNTRSDRVDGHDLNNLAMHYTQTSADIGFDALIDTTYDGQIDGNDLIDIGAAWALTY